VNAGARLYDLALVGFAASYSVQPITAADRQAVAAVFSDYLACPSFSQVDEPIAAPVRDPAPLNSAEDQHGPGNGAGGIPAVQDERKAALLNARSEPPTCRWRRHPKPFGTSAVIT
jgi:hypothetical protein